MDDVTLSVIKGRLEEVADEMDATLFRAAFSPVIAEARDASHGIYDAVTGDTLFQGKMGLPIFVGSMSFAVKAVIDRATKLGGEGGGFKDGDAWVLNDPYLGGTHLNDIKIIRPVFHDGRILCFLASAGHWIDVGGNVPGNFNPIATDTFQEGVRIPPVKLIEAGVLREDIVEILLAMSRIPRNCYGDLNGQLNALEIGADRIKSLISTYGADELRVSFTELRARAARMMRSYIAELPDGTYRADDWMDNDGITDTPLAVAVDVTISGDHMTIDFARSAKACAGPVNISRASTVAACYVAIKHIFPDVPANAGCLDPIEIKVPEGSLLDARFPRPVCGYTETVTRVIDTLFMAIGEAGPTIANAAPFGTINALSMAGTRANGEPWVLFTFHGGGHGGNPQSDGLNNGNPAMGMATIPPAEIIEAAYPVLYRSWALRPGSGGAGRHRGGLGTVQELELLEGNAVLSVFGDRVRFSPPGIAGGKGGAPNRVSIDSGAGFIEPPMGAKISGVKIAAGSRVRVETPGGGGYGAPSQRPVDRVERDARLGYTLSHTTGGQS